MSNTPWSPDQILHLIALIRERRNFWHPKHPNYHKRQIRRETLFQIRMAMGEKRPNTSDAEIIAKFRSLKAQLSRELRARKSRTGDPKKIRKELWCFEELKFLKETMQTRVGKSNVPPASVHSHNLLLEPTGELEELDLDEDLDCDGFVDGQVYECELDENELQLMMDAEELVPNVKSAAPAASTTAPVATTAAPVATTTAPLPTTAVTLKDTVAKTTAVAGSSEAPEKPGTSGLQEHGGSSTSNLKPAYKFVQNAPKSSADLNVTNASNNERTALKDATNRWTLKRKKTDNGEKLVQVMEKGMDNFQALVSSSGKSGLGSLVEKTMDELSPNKAKKFKKKILKLVLEADEEDT